MFSSVFKRSRMATRITSDRLGYIFWFTRSSIPARYASQFFFYLKKFQTSSGTWQVINFNFLKPPCGLLKVLYLIFRRENRIIYQYNTRIIYSKHRQISRIISLNISFLINDKKQNYQKSIAYKKYEKYYWTY